MNTILSTKILSTSQRELILNAGLGLVEYNAIQVKILGVENPKEFRDYGNLIITSKNAVRAIQKSEIRNQNYFCVGPSTKKMLEKNGLKVVETAQNAADLAKIIVNRYKNQRFLFLCGNLRREELPKILREHKVDFAEQMVYKTTLSSRSFDRDFDGVLFYSPSGVESYFSDNKINKVIAFCIGNTTASEARNYTNDIFVANKPTIENVIVQVVKYFRN